MSVDLTMMYASHDAFRRDLDRLVAAATDGRADHGVRAGWETFKQQLIVHHEAEDEALWPALRSELAGRPEALALLDAMEDEHEAIDPLLDAVGAALDDPGPALRERAEALAEALRGHLEHEETEALPLITPEIWSAFLTTIRRRQGIRNGAVFFPWLLDGLPARQRAKVLGTVPPPVRLLYRAVWRPRYARAARWAPA